MSSPLRVAKIANLRARFSERLAGRTAFPDETARELVDELLNLGWTYPGWQADDHMPQPSASTPEGRRRARELYEATRREAKA